jgi:hypothetical protein
MIWILCFANEKPRRNEKSTQRRPLVVEDPITGPIFAYLMLPMAILLK